MSGIHMALMGSATALDTQIVTTGGTGSALEQDRVRGYNVGEFGTIVDGMSDIYPGYSIGALYWSENGGAPDSFYILSIFGSTNDGWTTLTIGSKVLLRTDASFTFGVWLWNTTDYLGIQAFESIGSTIVCRFD